MKTTYKWQPPGDWLSAWSGLRYANKQRQKLKRKVFVLHTKKWRLVCNELLQTTNTTIRQQFLKIKSQVSAWTLASSKWRELRCYTSADGNIPSSWEGCHNPFTATIFIPVMMVRAANTACCSTVGRRLKYSIHILRNQNNVQTLKFLVGSNESVMVRLVRTHSQMYLYILRFSLDLTT